MKHGKKYRAVGEKFDLTIAHPLEEAIAMLPETSTTKFDSTVEMHFNLGIDPKQSDQQIRNTISLPHGTGKQVVVTAFVPEDKVQEAKDAGADFAGLEDLIDKVAKEWTEFDTAVATPDAMKQLAKVAKILGTKRLMPSPKAGTVTDDIGKTISEIKKGRIEFRNDPAGIVHVVFGKVSFGKEKLLENAKALIDTILAAKPQSIKGTYVKSLTMTTSMGPGIKVDTGSLL